MLSTIAAYLVASTPYTASVTPADLAQAEIIVPASAVTATGTLNLSALIKGKMVYCSVRATAADDEKIKIQPNLNHGDCDQLWAANTKADWKVDDLIIRVEIDRSKRKKLDYDERPYGLEVRSDTPVFYIDSRAARWQKAGIVEGTYQIAEPEHVALWTQNVKLQEIDLLQSAPEISNLLKRPAPETMKKRLAQIDDPAARKE
ncbi:MAG: hypothetical protein AAF449_24130, partial [Myxococcota bacterium]